MKASAPVRDAQDENVALSERFNKLKKKTCYIFLEKKLA